MPLGFKYFIAARRGFRRCLTLWHAAVLAAGLAALPVLAADPPSREAASARQSEVNSITQAAVNAGALACAGRINQVTNFITAGDPSGAFLFAPPAQPDQRITSVSIEINSKEVPAAYASASFAPNQANGCGATYDAVVYWPQKCEAVAAKQFANLKRVGQIKTNITVLDGGVATKVFLMPAGSGCVSIKKEVVL